MPGTLRAAAMFVWESFLNVPYRWGGDDPLDGVDCSGLVQEGTRAVGLTERDIDYTADGLLTVKFKEKPRVTDANHLAPGMLVFWANPNGTIRHVEIIWATIYGYVLTIGASGGGSATVDRAAAVRQNAYVKIRRITPGWLCAIDPFPTPF